MLALVSRARLISYAAIALLVLGLSLALHLERSKSARLLTERNAARAELIAISTKQNEQKQTTDRNIDKARDADKSAKRIADRIRNAPVEPGCKTPAEILTAEL